jgi:hypothetical protein
MEACISAYGILRLEIWPPEAKNPAIFSWTARTRSFGRSFSRMCSVFKEGDQYMSYVYIYEIIIKKLWMKLNTIDGK